MAAKTKKIKINESGIFNNPLSWLIIFLFIISINVFDLTRGLEFRSIRASWISEDIRIMDLVFIWGNLLAILVIGVYVIYFFKKLFASELSNKWTLRESEKSRLIFIQFVGIIIIQELLNRGMGFFSYSEYLREIVDPRDPAFEFVVSLLFFVFQIYLLILAFWAMKYIFVSLGAVVTGNGSRSLFLSSKDGGARTGDSQEAVVGQAESESSIILLEEAISNNKRFEIIFLLLILLVLTIGIFSFFKFLGRSILSEVQESAQLVNTNEIKKYINQRPYAVRLKNINRISMQMREDFVKLPDDQLIKKRPLIIQGLETIAIDSATKIPEIDDNQFSELLFDLDKNAEQLSGSISKLPPVDWERIFIRIAILTLALFIIQLLFTAYKYIRTERTKIQNQLMAIFLTNYMDDDKKIDHFSKVIDELSKQSVSFGKVPESIVNSLIKAVGDSSKSFAKKGS